MITFDIKLDNWGESRFITSQELIPSLCLSVCIAQPLQMGEVWVSNDTGKPSQTAGSSGIVLPNNLLKTLPGNPGGFGVKRGSIWE